MLNLANHASRFFSGLRYFPPPLKQCFLEFFQNHTGFLPLARRVLRTGHADSVVCKVPF